MKHQIKTFGRRRLFLLSVYFLLISAAGFHQPAEAGQIALSGKTMGTTYSIKFIDDSGADPAAWQKKVDMKLKWVNHRLSMFDPESELSGFNRLPENRSLKISSDFYKLLVMGKELHQKTGGAWDGTVKPLVDLWGFGTEKHHSQIPDARAIKEALAKTGFDHIRIQPPDTVLKQQPLSLDLGSIAKGYGVDQLAEMFKKAGIRNVLVEIGGELHAAGHNRKGIPWQVGINRPSRFPSTQGIYAVLSLDDKAIASSGDYRNYFRKNGKTYSHLINPATGYPVDNGVASASVVSDTCAMADGLATALMVMDVSASLDLINQMENTECLIITRNGKTFQNHFSKNFKALMR